MEGGSHLADINRTVQLSYSLHEIDDDDLVIMLDG